MNEDRHGHSVKIPNTSFLRSKLTFLPLGLGVLIAILVQPLIPVEFTAELLVHIEGEEHQEEFPSSEKAQDTLKRIQRSDFFQGASPECKAPQVSQLILPENLGGSGTFRGRLISGSNLLNLTFVGPNADHLKTISQCVVDQLKEDRRRLFEPWLKANRTALHKYEILNSDNEKATSDIHKLIKQSKSANELGVLYSTLSSLFNSQAKLQEQTLRVKKAMAISEIQEPYQLGSIRLSQRPKSLHKTSSLILGIALGLVCTIILRRSKVSL